MTGYTPYQKGVIKRYYEHRETLALQQLAEIISDLYLAQSQAQKDQLWKRAEKAMARLKVPASRMERITSAQDMGGLAALLTELQR